MPIIAYTITLEQPVLATSLLGDPNSTVSYDYIPGSTLRGLCAGRFRSGPDGTNDARFRRLFLSGHLRFLNAYPLAIDGTRCLPTPRSLQHPKGGNGARLQNRAIDPGELTTRWKEIDHPFCVASAPVDLYNPLRTITVHVQRDRHKGRAWRDRPDQDTEVRYGTVFRYEALAAGQQFAAIILTDDAITSEDLDAVRALLRPATCWLGRSRSAGYGRARLAEQAVADDWREAAATAPTGAVQTMTLLSPAILRAADGEEIQRIDDATLSAYLGCAVAVIPERTFSNVEMVGGFNRHWGLPLPQQRALAMGSVITFQVTDGTLDTAALESSGIGERLAEGFGRVAFNWLNEASYQGQVIERPATEVSDAEQEHPQLTAAGDSSSVTIPPAIRPLATRTANRLFDTRIDAVIIAFVQRAVWPQVRPNDTSGLMPTNSQLARLHTLVRQAAATGDTQAVKREFLHFRDTARFAFERARLADGKGSLADWVYTLLDQPQRVWSELSAPTDVKIGDITPSQDDLRTRQVALRLLAAVLAAPAQRRKGREFMEVQP